MSCTIDSLTTASTCFNCLSESQKKKAILLFLVKALAALDGTDYSDTATLTQASACFKCVSKPMLLSFLTAIAQDYASRVGASVDWTVNELLTELGCWQCMDPKVVDAGLVLLTCELKDIVRG